MFGMSRPDSSAASARAATSHDPSRLDGRDGIVCRGDPLIYAALSFAVGFALMNRKPWGARTPAIVAAILQLIKIPFGTALGIYTLWVLIPAASGAEYDAIADRS